MKIKIETLRNIIMLYGFTIAKIVFPLLLLPYLTRVLSVGMYGFVCFVMMIMQYMQLLVDFGFSLFGTKQVVECRNDKGKLQFIVSDIFVAQQFLAFLGLCSLIVMQQCMALLVNAPLYTFLKFIPIFLTPFLFEHLFRGLEKMEVVTVNFLIFKGLAVGLTFFFVKSDQDVLWIPILDIVGYFIAACYVQYRIRRLGIHIVMFRLLSVVNQLKQGFVYFASNMASSAYGALNAVAIGIFASPGDVAFWSVCNQLITGGQMLFYPVINGIFPEMVKTKNMRLIRNITKIFLPIVLIGTIFTVFVAKYALLVIAGEQYIGAERVLQYMAPILAIGFITQLVGWPVLGAIGKAKEIMSTTVSGAVVQSMGIIFLVCCGWFSVLNLALLRCFSESVMMFGRLGFNYHYRDMLKW